MTKLTKTPTLSEAIKVLDESVTEMLYFFQELDVTDLPLLLKSFALLKDNKDKLSLLEKLVSEQYQKLSYQVIPNVFETFGLDSAKSGGRNFILSTRVNATIPEDKREFGYRWIADTAKVPELIRETINSQQLSAFARGYFETNAMWPPEEAMSVHQQQYIQVRKA